MQLDRLEGRSHLLRKMYTVLVSHEDDQKHVGLSYTSLLKHRYRQRQCAGSNVL